jgi:hypothetical protein
MMPAMFWRPECIIVKAGGLPETELTFDNEGNGYNYEAAAVGRCLRKGQLESGIVSLDTTLANMRTLDRCREQWGLVYPMER